MNIHTRRLVANEGLDLFEDGKPMDGKGVWSDTIFANESIRFIKAGDGKSFFNLVSFPAGGECRGLPAPFTACRASAA